MLGKLLFVAGFYGMLGQVGPAAPIDTGSEDLKGLFQRLDADRDGILRPGEAPVEHAALFDRLLRRADANADGGLDSLEFRAGLTPKVQPKPLEELNNATPGLDAVKLLLLRLDTNRDTRLTAEEAPKELESAFESMLRELDASKDGSLDFRELIASGPKLPRLAQRIANAQGWDVPRELRREIAQQGDLANRFEASRDPREALANPQRAAALFAQLDENQDGQVRPEEVPDQAKQRVAPLLKRADRDGDGGVSLAEYQAALAVLNRRMAAQQQPLGQEMMTDTMELEAGGESVPGRPRSKSAKRSLQSGPAALDPQRLQLAQRLVERMVDRADANRNGMIERSEARGRLAANFDAADQNGDTTLDRAELGFIVQEVAARLPAPR